MSWKLPEKALPAQVETISQWRKYGTKTLRKGKPQRRRDYYRCTHPGCPVKKYVDASEDSVHVKVSYVGGDHVHGLDQAQKSNSAFSGPGEPLAVPHALSGGDLLHPRNSTLLPTQYPPNQFLPSLDAVAAMASSMSCLAPPKKRACFYEERADSSAEVMEPRVNVVARPAATRLMEPSVRLNPSIGRDGTHALLSAALLFANANPQVSATSPAAAPSILPSAMNMVAPGRSSWSWVETPSMGQQPKSTTAQVPGSDDSDCSTSANSSNSSAESTKKRARED